jgi:hypothetical protein
MNKKMMIVAILLLIPFISILTPKSQQYYQSEWTTIEPLQAISFRHKFGQLPSFYDVYVAANLDIASFNPASVIPYRDLGYDCLKVNMITPDVINVVSSCDSYQYIQVKALLIP